MASSSSDPAGKSEVGRGGGETETGEAAAMKKNDDELIVYREFKKSKKERGCTAKERISRMPPSTAGKRSSIYRGVTRSISPSFAFLITKFLQQTSTSLFRLCLHTLV